VAVDDGFVVSAEVDEDAEAELLAGDDVRAVFADPVIAPFPTVCPDGTGGSIGDVATPHDLTELIAQGHRGRGVRVAIVDTGIDGTQVNVSGGWSPWPGVAPGAAPAGHGTMCAVDVLVAAPDAQIHDYPLLRSTGGVWVAFLSDAIRFFAEIMTVILRMPGPMVVSNSWGLFNRAGDAAVGHPQNYGANPAHPFNTITSALVASGADVLFAAGNCGAACPDGRCGSGDTGPGNSIHGANGHPDVTTVAAVTVDGDHLGYSSQGPAGLSHDKPDICGFSHFDAPGIDPSFHAGTSAACPVVAGVVAALRSKPSARALPPAAIRAALIAGATPVGGSGWSPDTGHGIVDAGAAWSQV
jgi:subtilisin family serine protease